MNIYTERTERRGSGVSSDNEDTFFNIRPSAVLKFASGPDICQKQQGAEDESPSSKDQQSRKTLRHEKNWTKKVQMSTIIKEIKASRMQESFNSKVWDITNHNLGDTKSAPCGPPGTDGTVKATTLPTKKHGTNRRLKENSQHDRSSPPCAPKVNRPSLNRTLSSPVEDLDCHAVPHMKRRLSDPSLSQTNRPQVNRKSRASLIRRVSPLQLLSKVTTSSNAKAVGSLSPRLAKRLYPTISKLHGQLGARDAAGGSDPAINVTHEGTENECSPFENYGDFRRQIHCLAEDIESLNIHQFDCARKLKDRKEVGMHSPCEEETRQAYFKDSDVKLQGLMEDILRAHLLTLTDYKPASCDRMSRNVCKLISDFLGAMKTSTHAQSKFVCLVYIGAVRDQGIDAASRALWNPQEDSYAVASFRNEFVYGIAAVFATPID